MHPRHRSAQAAKGGERKPTLEISSSLYTVVSAISAISATGYSTMRSTPYISKLS